MEEMARIFNEAMAQLKESSPKADSSFLENIAFASINGDEIVLSVPSDFVKKKAEKYRVQIDNLLSEMSHHEVHSRFTVIKEQKVKDGPSIQKDEGSLEESPKNTPHRKKNNTLNPKYTLDNFISGDNSQLAYSAAKIISKNPGVSFNPCLIYGGVGLGKTHLLNAIGNAISDEFPSKSVVYVSSDVFIDEFIESLNNQSIKNKFKDKYWKVDALLIDDIQFLQKKEKTQEELFKIFNVLYEDGKQIVFTCDRPITELKDITERLRTRFVRGFNVDLQPPPFEVRMAIARQKIKERNLKLPSDVVNYVCENIKSNVRDLEGTLTTLSGMSDILGRPVTIELAKEQLKNVIGTISLKKMNITIDDIFIAVSNYFNTSVSDLRGNKRSRSVQIPRQIATYLAYEYGKFTFSEIGSYLDKDHTSVSYSFNKIESQIEGDEALKNAVRDIIDRLGDT